MRRIETFGFHTVSLDIRQNATVINRTVAARDRSAGRRPARPRVRRSGPRRCAEALQDDTPLDRASLGALTEEANETLDLFELVAETRVQDRRRHRRGDPVDDHLGR